MKYFPRNIEKVILHYLDIFPSVAITGPRQSGKSTTLRKIFVPEYEYVTFDDPLNIDFFERDPKGFLKNHSKKVIFDEAQKVPKLFNYLKIFIDNNRQEYGDFLLTGSSQFSFIKEITESLAGRAGLLSLLPLQVYEIPAKLRSEQILKGSYPELAARKYTGNNEWCAAYIRNYIERDVRSLYNIGDLRDFQRLVTMLAARCSQELNMSELSREIGITVKTIQKWISVLEASYIIFLLPPYYKNLGKRIVKRPKIYYYDTGLINYLTGISTLDMLEKGPLAGPIFENYIISEVIKAIMHNNKNWKIFYFRSNLGLEVDFIIEDIEEKRLMFIEIKSGYTAHPRMTDDLKKIIEAERKVKHITPVDISGVVLYKGDETIQYNDFITFQNYMKFLKVLSS